MKDELLAAEVALEGDRAEPPPKPRRARKRKAEGDYDPYQLPPGELGPGRHVVLADDTPVEVEEPLGPYRAERARADALTAYATLREALSRGEPEAVAAWVKVSLRALRGVRVAEVRARVYLDPDGVVRARAPGPDGYRVVLERMPTPDELALAGAPDRLRALRPLVERLPLEPGGPREPA